MVFAHQHAQSSLLSTFLFSKYSFSHGFCSPTCPILVDVDVFIFKNSVFPGFCSPTSQSSLTSTFSLSKSSFSQCFCAFAQGGVTKRILEQYWTDIGRILEQYWTDIKQRKIGTAVLWFSLGGLGGLILQLFSQSLTGISHACLTPKGSANWG